MDQHPLLCYLSPDAVVSTARTWTVRDWGTETYVQKS